MPDLTDAERAALHDLQLGIEHVHRAHGHLLEFHHRIGHAMDRLHDAEQRLRDAGHEAAADRLRDEILPSGFGGADPPSEYDASGAADLWTYELVELFQDGMLEDVTAFETAVRGDLAGGERHLAERAQQREWRERAEGWRSDSTD